MGKRKQTSKYEHNHTYNPRARESDDRKIQSLKNLELKRLNAAVSKSRETMQSYVPPESRKKYKIDPQYELKGAARAAQEFYRPPDFRDDVEPVDLFALHKGKVWDHEEGQKLLCAMMELGVAQHNTLNKSKEAINVFKEMMDLDKEDHLLSRHRLLRCYLDMGEALQARTLMDKFPADHYSCFAYNRALIEFIALSLEESDASEKVRDDALHTAIKANPHTVWVIAYHDVFSECVKHVDKLQNELPCSIAMGSVEDAFMFLDVDLPLWLETEGLVEYVQDFIVKNELVPPLIQIDNENEEDVADADEEDSENDDTNNAEIDDKNNDDVEEEEEGEDSEVILSPSEMHEMYVDMFVTAIEMIEEQQNGDDK